MLICLQIICQNVVNEYFFSFCGINSSEYEDRMTIFLGHQCQANQQHCNIFLFFCCGKTSNKILQMTEMTWVDISHDGILAECGQQAILIDLK